MRKPREEPAERRLKLKQAMRKNYSPIGYLARSMQTNCETARSTQPIKLQPEACRRLNIKTLACKRQNYYQHHRNWCFVD